MNTFYFIIYVRLKTVIIETYYCNLQFHIKIIMAILIYSITAICCVKAKVSTDIIYYFQKFYKVNTD